MKILKFLAAAAALVATSTLPVAAKPLPACNDPEVEKMFIDLVRPMSFYELTDWQGSGGEQRWCYAFFAGGRGLGVPYLRYPFMEAVFTLEWVNEADDRYWLQIRDAVRSCRGIMGDPMSMARCN